MHNTPARDHPIDGNGGVDLQSPKIVGVIGPVESPVEQSIVKTGDPLLQSSVAFMVLSPAAAVPIHTESLIWFIVIVLAFVHPNPGLDPLTVNVAGIQQMLQFGQPLLELLEEPDDWLPDDWLPDD